MSAHRTRTCDALRRLSIDDDRSQGSNFKVNVSKANLKVNVNKVNVKINVNKVNVKVIVNKVNDNAPLAAAPLLWFALQL